MLFEKVEEWVDTSSFLTVCCWAGSYLTSFITIFVMITNSLNRFTAICSCFGLFTCVFVSLFCFVHEYCFGLFTCVFVSLFCFVHEYCFAFKIKHNYCIPSVVQTEDQMKGTERLINIIRSAPQCFSLHWSILHFFKISKVLIFPPVVGCYYSRYWLLWQYFEDL